MRIADLCCPPIYHLLGNVIYAAVGLVYINVQPEYELPGAIHLGQCQKLEKIELDALSYQVTPKEKISALGMSSCS